MSTFSLAGPIDRIKLSRIADALMAAVLVALPWSTSATGILLALWLIALIPTLPWPDVRREILTPAGGLPVLLLLLGIAGMAWADVSLLERWKGLDSFIKLLAIPLLLVQFRRSDRGEGILAAFVLSCIALLVVSYILALWPHPVYLFSHDYGVPVKNAASQSGEFVICIFGLVYLAHEDVMRRRWARTLVLLAVILAMLANMIFVATSRTALLTILVLLVLFAIKKLSARGNLVLLAAVIVLGAAGWFSSSYLRARVDQVWTDYQQYEAKDSANSSGERLEFYKRSLAFIREAPILGHGTGSIPSLFRQAAAGKSGAAGRASTNPHNQTFAVAIQLGLAGAVVLWAVWIAHLLLFRGGGLAAWVGLVIVAQNIVGSLLNSHLFDFLQGWIYVLGVGIAGGMALKNGVAEKPSALGTLRRPAEIPQ